MKLLSFKVGELGKDETGKDRTFRSLHSGFSIKFHSLATEKGLKALTEFQPFCFAGLNGSGKSNVLEALAAIFFHLEMCVAKFQPDNFKKHFNRRECAIDAFELSYLTCGPNKKDYVPFLSDVVTISKERGKEPKMIVGPTPISKDKDQEPREVSLVPTKGQEQAAGKQYLPDLVVGYSSGENEILSLPFIKHRLIHFDEYHEAVKTKLPFHEPETSLLYIDQEMSQAVLLACLLFEDEETLRPLKKELGILGIRSFRMHLNNQELLMREEKNEKTYVRILQHLNVVLDKLRKCTPFELETEEYPSSKAPVITLDFFVDDNTKRVFQDHFNSSFELFRFFQILYELNAHIITPEIKEEVYKSKGYYTDGKLPTAGPDDRVFYFLDYMILKKIEGEDEPKELLLREFSDGEHQFIHSMGICLMLKDRRTLLLLDEPETHFNPGWRAKFIKVLNDSIRAGGTNNFLKDILLTSHSPFIISDCLPNNVIFFKKNKENKKVEAKSARSLNFNTYGTSVEIILDELFEYNQSIGDWSNEKLKEISFEDVVTDDHVKAVKEELRILGDSIEKDLVLAKLNKIKSTNA